MKNDNNKIFFGILLFILLLTFKTLFRILLQKFFLPTLIITLLTVGTLTIIGRIKIKKLVNNAPDQIIIDVNN